MTGRARAGMGALGVAAVLAIAAWARLANVPAVLGTGELLPPDGDSAYHLLRILRTAEGFPRVPTFDPNMSWPAGGMCPWADGFDLGGAAMVRALGGGSSRARAEVIAALYPVLLGVLLVWATMALARAVAPEVVRQPVAIASGLLLALIPQAVASSRYGRIDHHVMEALAMVLLARWAATRPDPAAPAPRRLLFELEAALLSAGAVYVFVGATLYVAIAAAVVLGALLASRAAPVLVGSGAPGLLCGAGLAAVLTFPSVAQHGRIMSYLFPSMLQPALVGAAAAGLGIATLARRLPRAGVAARAAAFLTTAVSCAAAVALVWPGLLSEVARGIGGWLLHRDPWLSGVDEFQPLFSRAKFGTPWSALYSFFGSLGWSALPAIALGAVESVRCGRARGAGFLFAGAALCAMTLLQNRFGRVFAPFLAIFTALGMAWLLRITQVWKRRRTDAGWAILLAAALIAVVDPRLRTRLAISAVAAPDAIQSAALDLRGGPRPSRGYGPGVATPWDLGHHVEAIAGRPVVANGFGSLGDPQAFEDMARLSTGTESELNALLERRDLGFLVAGAATMPGHSSGGSPVFERRGVDQAVLGREYLRTVPLAPLLIAGSGVPALGVPHLPHLLPRFASTQIVQGLSFPLPVLWVYERVAGARLAGTARPGAPVVAELPFEEHGRPHTYRAFAVATAGGRWEMVLPVPTSFARPSLRTAPAWWIRVGDEPPALVVVPEDAVRSGSFVPTRAVLKGRGHEGAPRARATEARGAAPVPGSGQTLHSSP